MEVDEQTGGDAQNERPAQSRYNPNTTNANRVDGDKNLDEHDLKRSFNFGAATEPVKEGKAMGGHKFGQESHPPTGDDKNNPSQNAGYTNAYLAKTEPSEEYTQDNNFKAPGQEGEPDYLQSTRNISNPEYKNHGEHTGPGDNAE